MALRTCLDQGITDSILAVNPNTGVRYDSVSDQPVNKVARVMYVIFQNDQSYPQWELSWKLG
eukprot:CAMPEP_0205800658 /NCGR_PEP_ID=MMETSP0205-20121125/2391_1 /ASSEMBLY_ACC=CAM_ASM_000278 /TAXON_ID=36767 /ORGANISM="Euplotes focardii, Strain TN1" /LENGTH=61 /DNA_ID=CAMNT_0053064115 /DNA_START=274 /DNA_END=455 /DNA_ORIENTATION=-